MANRKLKQTTVYLTAKHLNSLRRISKRTSIPQAALIRMGVEAVLEASKDTTDVDTVRQKMGLS